jgi:hypothetical protein
MTGSAGGVQAPEGACSVRGAGRWGCGRLHRPVTEPVICLVTDGTLAWASVLSLGPSD